MRRAGTLKPLTAENAERAEKDLDEVLTEIGVGDFDSESAISEQDQKVIVRSNGTVGYVGKDIAYHMWKFGLLGKDFGYRRFYHYPVTQKDCWVSATKGEEEHPHFGDVAENYNVIDVRQSEAQETVKEALRDLGHAEAADRFTHISYGMVVLTPRCAAELGYNLSEEDKTRPFIGVSGRKGFGVKADDLLDALIASAKQEVDSRHPEREDSERREIAEKIAIGALRYFMLKYTKPSVIAFDFKDALSFEGETGPYAQYAVVRATNIFRKGGLDAGAFSKEVAANISPADLSRFLSAKQADNGPAPTTDDRRPMTGADPNELWELWLTASKTAYIVDQCISTTEPAYLAKHVFQLAQMFNTFYHRYPILSEENEERKKFLLSTAAVVRRELIRALGVLGIEVPSVM
jgi:arginyl-tRNA synthetase